MGICCTGKISKTEYRNKEIIRNQRHTPQTGISPKIEPSLSFDINNSPLNTNINLLISECQNSHYNFKVSKINFDLLWNIVIEYKYDYTSCNYIIKDFRKSHPDNFVKQFKQINYKVAQLEIISPTKIEAFKKFLKNKNIICIVEEENLENLQKIIQYFGVNVFEISSIMILDNNLISENAKAEIKHLTTVLNEEKEIECYPYMLFSAKYFPHLESQGCIFFQRFTQEQLTDANTFKFTSEILSELHTKKNDSYVDFCVSQKINLITRVVKGEFSHCVKNFKRKKSEKEQKNNNNCSLISIAFKTLADQKHSNEVEEFINTIKNEINKKNSVILQVENTFDDLLLLEIIFVLIWKITNVNIELINDYISTNCVPFIANISELYTQHKSDLLNILQLFGYKI